MPRLAADLILRNGRIHTLDVRSSIASAMAVRDGRILAVGSEGDLDGLAGPETQVMDLGGRTAIPGIVDSHCHPDSYAARLAGWEDVGPKRIQSRAALLARLSDVAAARGTDEWVVAYRLNENKSGGYPTLAELDAAGQGRPLFILRTDGHIGLANSRAFRELGIDCDTPDPAFGRFDHHPETGELTGLMRETAVHLFLEMIHGADTPARLADGLEKVFDDWARHGVTTVYNSLAGSRSIQAYQLLRQQERLRMRVGIIVSGREDGLVESYVKAGIRSGFGDDMVRVIGVEWCPDCSTSGRTAAYYEPYVGTRIEGEPDPNTGMLLYELEDLKLRALAAHKAGLQVMIEGVGDRGIDFALDVIEHCLDKHPVDDHRMRVEHCCYVTPPILERLKRVGAVDSSATGFMYDLGDAYRANRGEAAMRWMWPHRSLIDAGIPAPGHSDAMVCDPNPFFALWSMVNRKAQTGASLDEAEAVTAEEALRAYTVLGAWSGREEAVKGSLEPGKLADIAVLDRDYFSIPAEEIREVGVTATLLGGRLVHGRL
ncbi:amidohydrolase [Oceanibaculum nanhaiense]|uniref:amidohydrolase n=1 Tax=Oceanibaculum nanhaiense TaxID=1909734 RepID=UPI00396E6C29